MKTQLCILTLLLTTPAAAQMAQLQVRGEPGHGQSPWITILRCRQGSDGFMARESCDGAPVERPLNVAFEVEAGYYALNYSNSLAFVAVRPGEKVNVALETISPDMDIPERVLRRNLGIYKVSRDMSRDVERQKLLQMFWGRPPRGYGSAEACAGTTALEQRICASWRSPRGAAAFGWMLASARAGFSWIGLNEKFRPMQQLFVNETTVPYGDYALVLPGAYLLHDDTLDEIESESVGFDKVLRTRVRELPKDPAPPAPAVPPLPKAPLPEAL